MSSLLCITLRFLDPVPQFHGRGDSGDPEWPPSPLRLFQAMVAASAARWRKGQFGESAAPALRWLETIEPTVVAPQVPGRSFGYRMYVPNNSGDLMTAAWARGDTETSMAKFRVEKDVRSTHLHGEAVCFLYPLQVDTCPHFEVLKNAARSITHLGWGIDMVAGNAEILSEAQAKALPGDVWRPASDHSGTALRVPKAGTLGALLEKHQKFLDRLSENRFKPVPPLATFGVVSYRRASDPPQRPFAAFNLLQPDASGFRAFNTASQAMVVAGMMRHAANADSVVHALGWPATKVAGFILGHGEAIGQSYRPVQGARLAYIPLPSIEFRGEGRTKIGSIRRALITVYSGAGAADLQQLARILSGAELIEEQSRAPAALLSVIPKSDGMVSRYTKPAATWATVTPVILPGYDDPRKLRKQLFSKLDAQKSALHTTEQTASLDKLDQRIDALVRKSIRQAGYSEELARDVEIAWRGIGFWPGTEPATSYSFPNQLRRFRRLHVRLTWRDSTGLPIAIPGPVCLGGGRFCGLGLFAGFDG